MVWSSTLTSDANYGYANLATMLPRLVAINGVAPAGCAHAAELFRDAHRTEAFYDLTFRDPGASGTFRVALDVDQVDVTDEDLLERYNIPDLCSPDLVDGPCGMLLGERREAELSSQVDSYYAPAERAPAPKPRRRRSKKRR